MHASIPTPSISFVEIGPFTLHFYALCIIAGTACAIWLSNRRFTSAYPETRGVVGDIAIVAVPAGVIGGRLYHVVTAPEHFFGRNGNLFDIVKIWQGGLGIWGAIALGALAAFLAYQRIGTKRSLPQFRHFADAVAPGIALAQAVGRWGNWFNGELFGRPTSAPWGLEIPQWLRPSEYQAYSTFHPTFLYESLWSLLIALLLLRFGASLAAGATFALYVALYCCGRIYCEWLRVDSAHLIFGIRLNILVAITVGVGAFVALRRFSRASR